jgi:ribosome maturation factor RimP
VISLIANTDFEKKIYNVLSSFFKEKELEITKIIFLDGKDPKLELYIDKLEGRLTVDECAINAREISYILDVENLIEGFYTLDVSSPGIDRSLTRIEDFSKYKQFKVKVKTNKSSLKGELLNYSDDIITINNKNGLSEISLSEIKDIKLDIDKLSFENIKKMESL